MNTRYHAASAHRDTGQSETFLTVVGTGPGRADATVNGTSGSDTLTGTSGDDVFNLQGGGTDRVTGLGGYDFFSFGGTLDATDRVDGGDGLFDEVGIQGNYNLTITGAMFTNVEALFMIAGGTYNITLAANVIAADANFSIYGGTGTAPITTNVDGSAMLADLSFFGSAGNDVFVGGSGNDFFRFRVGGNDTYDGGGGFNRVSLFGSQNGITFDLGARGAQAVGQGFVTVRNIQDVSGTSGADTLTGTAEANWFLGNGGNDVLIGLAGDDFFTVGPVAGVTNPPLATSSTVDGGRGVDIVDFAANTGNTGPATVSLQIADFQDTGQGVYKLIGIEGLTGTSFDDTLTGNSKGNSLFGSDGADTLIGAAGNDFLYGDAYYTTASTFGTSGPQYIDFNLTAVFADRLEGGRGRDQLDGGGGDDILIGGADGDILIGGTGADLFTFVAISDSTRVRADMILDFQSGSDKIDLSAIDADTGVRGDQAFHVGATPGHAGDILFSYDSATNTTTVEVFVDGDNKADMTINLTGQFALSDADFTL